MNTQCLGRRYKLPPSGSGPLDALPWIDDSEGRHRTLNLSTRWLGPDAWQVAHAQAESRGLTLRQGPDGLMIRETAPPPPEFFEPTEPTRIDPMRPSSPSRSTSLGVSPATHDRIEAIQTTLHLSDQGGLAAVLALALHRMRTRPGPPPPDPGRKRKLHVRLSPEIEACLAEVARQTSQTASAAVEAGIALIHRDYCGPDANDPGPPPPPPPRRTRVNRAPAIRRLLREGQSRKQIAETLGCGVTYVGVVDRAMKKEQEG